MAAEGANTIASNSLKESSRAWISPVSAGFDTIPKLNQPLKWGVQYSNPGHSPALDVRPIFRVRSVLKSSFDDNSYTTTVENDAVCDKVVDAAGADVIYPEQPNGYKLNFQTIEPSFINDPDIFNGRKAFLLEMCFAYKTIGTLHHTSFCYFYISGLTKDNQWNVCNAGNHAD